MSGWWRSARRASTTTATALHATSSGPRSRRRSRSPGAPALPVVIHLRDPAGGDDALSEAFATLAAEAEGVTVILHCCSVPPDRVGEAVERGWYCSFAGNVTYPNADALRETARLVPDDLLLVETDSPFLAPQSVRGKPNQPANVVEVAEGLAVERGLPYPSSSGSWRRTPRGSSDGERGRKRTRRPEPRRRPVVRLGQNFLADANLLEAIARDARPRSARRRARGWGRGGGAERPARAAGRAPARDRARPAAGRRPGDDVRPASESLGCLGRRDADRSRGASAVAHRGGLEPALLDRHPGAAADGRRAAGGRRVDGDGATEIADRLRADPGSRTYGAPSVLVQLACEVELLRTVDRAVFRPRPRVDSALLRLTRRGPAAPPGARPARARRVRAPPKAAWRARSSWPEGRPREAVRTALGGLGLDEGARAEALAPADFVRVAERLGVR